MRAIGLAVVIAACGAPPRAGVARDAETAFVHVSVIAMDSPQVLADQTVVVRGDRIVAIGPASAIATDAATIIDGHGGYLLPALADMHGHISDYASLTLLVANGVTTVRNMWGTRRVLEWKHAIEQNKLFGPTLYSAGPIMDGIPPRFGGSVAVGDVAEAVRAVDGQHATGYAFIKVLGDLKPEVYDAVVAQAKRDGMPVIGHVPFTVGLAHAIAAGQRSVEHLTGYFEAAQRDDSKLKDVRATLARQYQADFIDEAKLAELVRQTREAGTWNCPTLITYRKFGPRDESDQLMARPEMRFMPPLVRAGWDPSSDFRTKGATPADWAAMRRGDAMRARIVHDLAAAGAHLVTGTDFENPFIVPGFSLLEEIDAFVTAGLSPYEALRASTKEASDLVDGDFGVIAVGKRADLLLVEGNPLADIHQLRRRRGVMMRGAWYPEAQLQARLEPLVHAFDEGDRLAARTAMPGARTYIARAGRTFAGDERLAREPHAIAAQAAYDEAAPGSMYSEARQDFDDRGAVTRLELRRESFAGSLSAQLQVDGARLRGRVFVAPHDQLELDEPATSLYVTTPLGTWQLAVDRAGALDVSESRDVTLRDFEIEPMLHVVDVRETVKRLPDRDGARRYAIAEHRQNGESSAEVTLDASGQIQSAHGELSVAEVELTAR